MAERVLVIGAGIGGLTAGALLAQRGYEVKVYEQAAVVGGCASSFRRRGFIFDVGATQVAGLEPGGIHQLIFSQLGLPLPEATDCDPACAVFLPGEGEPICVWRDPQRWQQERQRQFPGSEPFWQLLQRLFQTSWRFQSRDPILPPRNGWDGLQLFQALRPETLITVPFTLMTVTDALRLLGLGAQQRLKTFLDLQLKLYSQVGADETALLYAATALAVAQAPQGLSHLQGSMQVLADSLVTGLEKYGGQLYRRHRVHQIEHSQGRVQALTLTDLKTGTSHRQTADHIIANVTAPNLIELLAAAPQAYKQRIQALPPASGAFVIYLGVQEAAIPSDCPPHLQFLYDAQGPIGENNSLFVSVSQAGDGRAPLGQRTIVASSFTDVGPWWRDSAQVYEQRKATYRQTALARLGQYFTLTDTTLLHQEVATPRTFERFTLRQQGIVGGVGQRIATFGPFGLATRSPIQNLWLAGDSVHPGEGTAGVSYSARSIVRQILAGL